MGGLDAQDLRLLARSQVMGSAAEYSRRLGLGRARHHSAEARIVATGHQPGLYHPGIWVKDFLLQRLSDESGATGIDFVVDSDAVEPVAVTVPEMGPTVTRRETSLQLDSVGACYACTPAPSPAAIAEFLERVGATLTGLPVPAVSRHFRDFGEALELAAHRAVNLAELLTAARRLYEGSAGTDYLEASVVGVSGTEAFSRFAVHLALNARRLAGAFNAELAEYRARTGTRNLAQPFPDLAQEGDAVELPLWALADSAREPVWAVADGDTTRLVVAGGEIAALTVDPAQALSSLDRAGIRLAPRAVALTMFVRMFCCDLFIHGLGGGRYDRVTDGIIRRFWGVEPPRFAVASMTMHLPLGVHLVSDEEVARAKDRLNRLEHNPDSLLADVEFDSAEESAAAADLAQRKADLVHRIALAGADRKALGAEIRAVNAELARLLTPLREEYDAVVRALDQQRESAKILNDRTYPYCLWDPREIADKVK